ncbi:transcription elongation factor GreA [Erysipelotrichaceae bacterium]|nr:transcription elongation factor GreA [Erysipelotrichaceae bacterium]
MSTKNFQMTKEGKEQLEQELENLLTVKRKEVIERIQIAREFGDLSENSEYDAARDEQATIETRITIIENMLQNAEIIEIANSEIVQFGSTVTFEDLTNKITETFRIVGTAEANPLEGKISSDSPIAKAIDGQTKGATVRVMLPTKKEIRVTILDVK